MDDMDNEPEESQTLVLLVKKLKKFKLEMDLILES